MSYISQIIRKEFNSFKIKAYNFSVLQFGMFLALLDTCGCCLCNNYVADCKALCSQEEVKYFKHTDVTSLQLLMIKLKARLEIKVLIVN